MHLGLGSIGTNVAYSKNSFKKVFDPKSAGRNLSRTASVLNLELGRESKDLEDLLSEKKKFRMASGGVSDIIKKSIISFFFCSLVRSCLFIHLWFGLLYLHRPLFSEIVLCACARLCLCCF